MKCPQVPGAAIATHGKGFVLCRHLAVPPPISLWQTNTGWFCFRGSNQEPGRCPVSSPTPKKVTIDHAQERQPCLHQGDVVMGVSQASCGQGRTVLSGIYRESLMQATASSW